MKFLIDECLSPSLARHACDVGHEGVHVNWRQLSGAKDWDLLAFIEEGNWTFVMRNSVDFRGDADDPGRKGQYTRLEYHDGLICLNGPQDFDRHRQLAYFKLALAEIERAPDIFNQVIEVWRDESHPAGCRITRYALPRA
jgi:hypothetical protein